MTTSTAMSENLLQNQYESVFVLANEGLEAFYTYLETNNIPLFLSDEEEKYFQDQGSISASERLQFILKTSRIHQWTGQSGIKLEAQIGGVDVDEGAGDGDGDVRVSQLIGDGNRVGDSSDGQVRDKQTEDKEAGDDGDAVVPRSNSSSDDKQEDTTDSRFNPYAFVPGSSPHRIPPTLPKTEVCVLFQPPLFDSLPHIHDVILDTIRQARFSIKISMFLFTDIFIYNALCEAASNALVTVDILLDATQVDKFLEMLGKNGLIIPERVNICQNSGTGPYQRKTGATMGIAHEKFLICDESTAIIGSYNYTWSAAHINRENVIIIQEANHPIIKSLIDEFTRLQESWPCWGIALEVFSKAMLEHCL
ncbi:Protein FAM83F [Octopus vulgaris]|uniref:Protein FAM83F n=1 Tax=Octopus vulgaris TaxID=6645 RepID=A0AA36FPK4_OCTVU|nr:Protein FAM83F [Octopus vulgaris]